LPDYYNVPGHGTVYGNPQDIASKYNVDINKIQRTSPPRQPAKRGTGPQSVSPVGESASPDVEKVEPEKVETVTDAVVKGSRLGTDIATGKRRIDPTAEYIGQTWTQDQWEEHAYKTYWVRHEEQQRMKEDLARLRKMRTEIDVTKEYYTSPEKTMWVGGYDYINMYLDPAILEYEKSIGSYETSLPDIKSNILLLEKQVSGTKIKRTETGYEFIYPDPFRWSKGQRKKAEELGPILGTAYEVGVGYFSSFAQVVKPSIRYMPWTGPRSGVLVGDRGLFTPEKTLEAQHRLETIHFPSVIDVPLETVGLAPKGTAEEVRKHGLGFLTGSIAFEAMAGYGVGKGVKAVITKPLSPYVSRFTTGIKISKVGTTFGKVGGKLGDYLGDYSPRIKRYLEFRRFGIKGKTVKTVTYELVDEPVTKGRIGVYGSPLLEDKNILFKMYNVEKVGIYKKVYPWTVERTSLVETTVAHPLKRQVELGKFFSWDETSRKLAEKGSGATDWLKYSYNIGEIKKLSGHHFQTSGFFNRVKTKTGGLFRRRITVGQNIILVEPKITLFKDLKITNVFKKIGSGATDDIGKIPPTYKGLPKPPIDMKGTVHTGGFPPSFSHTIFLEKVTPYEHTSKLLPKSFPKYIHIEKSPTMFIPPGSITGISGVTIGRGGTSLFMDITPKVKFEPEIKSITDIKGDVKLATARATLRTPIISIKSDMLTDTMSDTRLDVFSGMRTATQSKLASAQKLASVFESSLIKETVEVPKMRTIGRIRFLSPPRGGGGGGAGGYGVGFYPIGYRFRKWKTPKMEDLLKLK